MTPQEHMERIKELRRKRDAALERAVEEGRNPHDCTDVRDLNIELTALADGWLPGVLDSISRNIR